MSAALEPFRFAARLSGRGLKELRHWRLLRTLPAREERARDAAWRDPARTPGRESILVVQLADIGDLAVTSPALRILRARFPAARIVLAVSPLTAPLARACPHVDEVAVLDGKGLGGPDWPVRLAGCEAWWEASARLRERHFPEPPVLALSVRTEWEGLQVASQIVVASSRARLRAGYPLKTLFGTLRSDRLLDVVPALDPALHEIDRQRALLRAIGIEGDDSGIPELWTLPESRARADAIAAALPPGRLRVVLALGSGHPDKVWPPERFAALAKRLEDELGAVPVWIGGPGDAAAAEIVSRAGLRRATDLVNRMPLDVTAAFLRHADLFVGSDSGPLHLAAAAGVPCVGFFLPGKRARWAPRTGRHAFLDMESPAALDPGAVFDAARALAA